MTDAAFAGSDTLATAKALAAALTHEGPFDLVLAGRNSVDADTGQVGPEVAELLDLPFLTGVRYLAIEGTRVDALRTRRRLDAGRGRARRRCCRARNDCASRPRSTRRGAPRCRPTGFAA